MEAITTSHVTSGDEDRCHQDLPEFLPVHGHPNNTSEVKISGELSLVVPMEVTTPEDTRRIKDYKGSDQEMAEPPLVYPNVLLSKTLNIREKLTGITPMETTILEDFQHEASPGRDSELVVLRHNNFAATENAANQDTWLMTNDEFMSETEDTKGGHIYEMLRKIKTEEIDLDQEDCKPMAKQRKSFTSGNLWDELSVQLSEIKQENIEATRADIEITYHKCPDIICAYDGKVAVDLIQHNRSQAEIRDDVPDIAEIDDGTTGVDISSSDNKSVIGDVNALKCTRCDYETGFQHFKFNIANHESRCHPDIASCPFQYNDSHKLYCYLCQFRTVSIGFMTRHLRTCHKRATDYYFCAECPFSTGNESELKRHQSLGHVIQPTDSSNITYDEAATSTYQCDHCYYHSPTKQFIENHKDRCHPADSSSPFQYNDTYKFHCHLCQYRSLGIARMAGHLSKCHRDLTTYFYCKTCPFSTVNESKLKRHQPLCHGIQPMDSSNVTYDEADTSIYKCDHCYYNSPNKHCFDNHKDRCHPDDSSSPFQYNDTHRFHCHLCQYRSPGIARMARHLSKCHRDLTTYFYCKKCPFNTGNESELKRHQSLGHGIQPMDSSNVTYDEADTYQCDHCYYRSPMKHCFEYHKDRCHPDDSSSPFRYNDNHKFHCHLCQYRSLGIARMARHLSKCHRDLTAYFYCKKCPFSTSDKSELKLHESSIHGTIATSPQIRSRGQYRCTKCYFQARLSCHIERHKNRCHFDDSSTPFQYSGTYKFLCPLCQYRAQEINLVAQHLKDCHRNVTNYLFCTACTFSTSDKGELERHNWELHQGVMLKPIKCDLSGYRCDKCFYHSTHKMTVETHIDRCHPDYSLSPFKYNDTYNFHCHLCQYRSQGITRMEKHLSQCHGNSTTYFYCTNCPFSTSDKSELERHSTELHESTKSRPITYEAITSTFQCGKCFYQSGQEISVENHIDQCHTDDSPSPFQYGETYKFHCHLCQYRVRMVDVMEAHLMDCHKKSTYYYCTSCPFSTSDQSELERHNSLHESRKSRPMTYEAITSTFQCGKCFYQSGEEISVENHIDQCHTDNSPSPFQYGETYKFDCHLCQYRARMVDVMEAHLMDCHKKSTYYYCTNCPFSTSDQSELERHNSLHGSRKSRPVTYETSTSTYQCEKCFYQSVHKLSIESHIDRCHLEDSPSPFRYNKTHKFHCHLCQHRSLGIARMARHLSKCHRDLTPYFYCTACPFSTSDESKLKLHELESRQAGHGDSKGQCTMCYFQSTKYHMARHRRRCHPDESSAPFKYDQTYRFHCHLCQCQAKTRRIMVEHLKVCHRDTTIYYYCSNCPFNTSDESELKLHVLERHQTATTSGHSHSKAQCTKCYFQSSYHMPRHRSRCHPEDSSVPFQYDETYKYHCHLCQYRAITLRKVVEHLKVCHRDTTIYYYCPNCPLNTSNESELLAHQESEKHWGQPQTQSDCKYHCTRCYFQSMFQFHLETHKNRCHLDDSSTPFQYTNIYNRHCPMCQYRSKKISLMASHLKQCHRDLTTYHFCTTCTFSTSDKSELERHSTELNHVNVSTTIKNVANAYTYQCDKCYYRSESKRRAGDHTRRCHSDDSSSPFPYNETYKVHCNLCQFRSKGFALMVNHRKRCHRDSTTHYYCTRCSFSTRERVHWNIHRIQAHRTSVGVKKAREPSGLLKCDDCSYETKYRFQLALHRTQCHYDAGSLPPHLDETCHFHCHLCQYRSSTTVKVAYHLKQCHMILKPYFYYCKRCPFITSCDDNLKQHMSEGHRESEDSDQVDIDGDQLKLSDGADTKSLEESPDKDKQDKF